MNLHVVSRMISAMLRNSVDEVNEATLQTEKKQEMERKMERIYFFFPECLLPVMTVQMTPCHCLRSVLIFIKSPVNLR